jgi:spermidine/putrescine transport system substrate-binding protein
MKKFFFAVAALVLPCVLVSNAFAADREHTLKVYNWADYIDMNVLNGFPAWYYEQTGEQVEVLYQTFDINESMLTEIEVGHEDYDVICPSEYIIERMLRNKLLQPINKDFGNTPDYTKLVSPFAVDKFQQMAPDSSVCVADYTVGYMWGTTGILYNTALVNKDEILSLGGLQNPKFAGKVFMKDAFRDIYSVVVLYAFREEIARGEVTRDELVANVTDDRIQRVEEFLTSMKNKQTKEVKCDNVIMCRSYHGKPKLYDELRGKVEVFLIGDAKLRNRCENKRVIHHAIEDAWGIANLI